MSSKASLQKEATASEIGLEVVAINGLSDILKEIHQDVERRAYELFEARGREPGEDLGDWFRAERQLYIPFRVLETTESVDHVTISIEPYSFDETQIMLGYEPNVLIVAAKKKPIEDSQAARVIYRQQIPQVWFGTVEGLGGLDLTRTKAILKKTPPILYVEIPKLV